MKNEEWLRIPKSYCDDILAAANETLPWEKLQGCNVLITGATGLIGGCLVEVLMSRGDVNVYAAGRNEERARRRFAEYKDNPHFHFFKYDVSRPLSDVSRPLSDVSRPLSEGTSSPLSEGNSIPFHYIIHAASDASPAAFASTPVDVIKSNIYGTANLIEYGMVNGMRRFLYVSTGEVYGEGGATEETPDGPAFKETDSGYVNPVLPRSCYPSSKRAAETLCAAYKEQYGADVVIARPCHTYGPHFTPSDNRVYAQFIRNVLRGEDIVMKSDGSQFRSWCYVVDCVRALLYILLKGESGEAYNIADTNSNITIRQLAEMIAAAAGRSVVIQLPKDSESNGYNRVTRSLFSTRKLEALGWTIAGNMSDKLARTVEIAQF